MTRPAALSERTQIWIVWWALSFGALYGLALGLLLHMIPPPGAAMTSTEVAQWYALHASEIRLGATATSYTGAFALPLWVVIAVQISRQESGRPIWAIMAGFGGALLSLALALPPLFLGVAAFVTDRAPDVTALAHQMGVLMLVTDVQWNPFAFVPIIAASLLPQRAPHTPFPRWYGYFTAWAALLFEAGPIAFNTRTGPFAWDGLLVFWLPVGLFGVWLLVTARLLLRALAQQSRDAAVPCTTEL